MRVNPCLLAIALLLASPAVAIAQPASPMDSPECKAEEAAIEQAMEIARSKGQMLRRRRLAEDLAALQARCDPLPEQSRAANIEKLEQEIQDLRKALEDAEAQLRRLKIGGV